MSSHKEIAHNLSAIMVIEVMGRPKEHLIEMLEKMATDIDNEKGVEVVSKKIHEPKELEKHKDLFSAFIEVEINVEQAMLLAILMFKYMPSHVEVIEPEKFEIAAYQFGDMLSEITRRLHQYDELLRVYQVEKIALEKKLKEKKE